MLSFVLAWSSLEMDAEDESPPLQNTNPGMMRPVCLTQIKCPQAAKV